MIVVTIQSTMSSQRRVSSHVTPSQHSTRRAPHVAQHVQWTSSSLPRDENKLSSIQKHCAVHIPEEVVLYRMNACSRSKNAFLIKNSYEECNEEKEASVTLQAELRRFVIQSNNSFMKGRICLIAEKPGRRSGGKARCSMEAGSGDI